VDDVCANNDRGTGPEVLREPFDITKCWQHKGFPLIEVEVDVLELSRNPENYFAEAEQSAFSTAPVVPGAVLVRARRF